MTLLTQFKANGLSNKGAYSAATTYFIDNVVTYGTATYVCTVDPTVNIVPTNTANWKLFVQSEAVAVATTGSGTNPASFTLSASGNTITLNKVS